MLKRINLTRFLKSSLPLHTIFLVTYIGRQPSPMSAAVKPGFSVLPDAFYLGSQFGGTENLD